MSFVLTRWMGPLAIVADDFSMPNGLAFSPDEKVLYVADSGFLTDDKAPIMSEPST
jgi:gluconolactonase